MTIHPFQSRGDAHRPGSAWRHSLDAAGDAHDVIASLRDFIASFTPYEIESLPPRLRPGKLLDAADVNGYAFELRHHVVEHEDSAALVRTFSDIFAYAAARLSQLASPGAMADRESA